MKSKAMPGNCSSLIVPQSFTGKSLSGNSQTGTFVRYFVRIYTTSNIDYKSHIQYFDSVPRQHRTTVVKIDDH